MIPYVIDSIIVGPVLRVINRSNMNQLIQVYDIISYQATPRLHILHEVIEWGFIQKSSVAPNKKNFKKFYFLTPC